MSDSTPCTACGEPVTRDDHADHCKGSVPERLALLEERLAALESAPRVAGVYRATIPTGLDGGGAPNVIGYFADKDVALESVRGKAPYGRDGDVRPVWVIVNADGGLFELTARPVGHKLVE